MAYTITEAERERRREQAKRQVAQGKIGGREFGKLGGRPKKLETRVTRLEREISDLRNLITPSPET